MPKCLRPLITFEVENYLHLISHQTVTHFNLRYSDNQTATIIGPENVYSASDCCVKGLSVELCNETMS